MQPANLRSPFQEGFAALREEPLLFAAELTWRWCFALAAWLLMLVAAALFLDSLKVSELDQFLLSTMQPALEWSAVNHILHGALLRAVWIKFIVLAGLTLLWAFAAAVGRAASLRNLDRRVRRRGSRRTCGLAVPADVSTTSGTRSLDMDRRRLLRRVDPSRIGHGNQRHAARAAFFYVFGIALSLVFGVMLNWFFGLAPLFCIRNQAVRRRRDMAHPRFLRAPSRTPVRLVAGISRVAAGLGRFDVLPDTGANEPRQTLGRRMDRAADVWAVPDLFRGSRRTIPRALGSLRCVSRDRRTTHTETQPLPNHYLSSSLVLLWTLLRLNGSRAERTVPIRIKLTSRSCLSRLELIANS